MTKILTFLRQFRLSRFAMLTLAVITISDVADVFRANQDKLN